MQRERDAVAQKREAKLRASFGAPSSSENRPDFLQVVFLVGMVAVCCLVILCVFAQGQPLSDPQWALDPTNLVSSPSPLLGTNPSLRG